MQIYKRNLCDFSLRGLARVQRALVDGAVAVEVIPDERAARARLVRARARARVRVSTLCLTLITLSLTLIQT